ncbi:MAG TPA: hypothetical protein VM869_09330, partial [Enhygromyxa sp.]|nr:hypothetical protein [Enhygromyxa sp.]
MSDDLHDVEVFADELQTRGDPRGELLSLELASDRAATSDEARRLHREAQRIRDAHESLVWPAPLRDTHVSMRAGFVVHATEELFASHIPVELALSLRSLWSYWRRLDDLLPTLVRARACGLALDELRHAPLDAGLPTNLAGMRALGGPGRWPAVRTLELTGPIERLEGLAGLTGLEHLDIDTPLDAAQLRSLAGLGLTSLGVRADRLEPALVELFGATLERLELRGCKDSLAPLRQLPRLRSLTLREDQSAQALADLAGLSQLEELSIPSLHDRRTLDALLGLRMRSLHVETVAAELLPEIARLTTLESFSYGEVTGEHVDLTPLLGL